ncbi:uncharacterized protein LOC142235831 [Haematobia irritans]|uniref:uncharacterized protein LOC142235831 n=1 Tax=Haematobia irritans TaxID=7368 RepID=UPI003F50551C
MCYGAEMDRSQTFVCPRDRVCVHLSLKCAESENGAIADCAAAAGCSSCDGNKLFTCTSRTTYAMCNGTQVENVHHSCPPRLFCDSRTLEICVDECHIYNGMKVDCDLEKPLQTIYNNEL